MYHALGWRPFAPRGWLSTSDFGKRFPETTRERRNGRGGRNFFPNPYSPTPHSVSERRFEMRNAALVALFFSAVIVLGCGVTCRAQGIDSPAVALDVTPPYVSITSQPGLAAENYAGSSISLSGTACRRRWGRKCPVVYELQFRWKLCRHPKLDGGQHTPRGGR